MKRRGLRWRLPVAYSMTVNDPSPPIAPAPAPVPSAVHDRVRLAALRATGLLDTGPEPIFDDIADAAAALCDAPIALVSLVDDSRQWFKARVGLDLRQTPVEQAVCAHALGRSELLVIADLTQDPRTRANPLVTGEAGLRFYAGAPLRMPDGQVLGSLCVIDTRPRPAGLTASQTRGLAALGRQVVNVIAMRRRVHDREVMILDNYEKRVALEEVAQGFEAAQAAGHIGTFEVDIASNTIRISDEMRTLYGIPPDANISIPLFESLIVEEDEDSASSLASRRSGTAALNVVYRIRRLSDGAVRSISRKASFERDGAGKPVRMHGVVQDVTEQAVINQEIAHRLKNMLALVMALASQTLKSVPDREPVRAFEKRLVALGVAHDALLRKYWVSAPIREIVTGVLGLVGQSGRIDASGPALTVGPKASLGLSLLLHELATNAVKYGALSVEGGRVALDWAIEDVASEPLLVVEWREKGGPPVTPPTTRSFGSRLIGMGLLGTGDAVMRYEPDGLQARFTASLEKAQTL